MEAKLDAGVKRWDVDGELEKGLPGGALAFSVPLAGYLQIDVTQKGLLICQIWVSFSGLSGILTGFKVAGDDGIKTLFTK